MTKGDLVVVGGRAVEVVELTPTGDMLVRDISTLKLKWVDYYIVRTIDPREEGLLLDALGALWDGDEMPPSEEGADGREVLEEL